MFRTLIATVLTVFALGSALAAVDANQASRADLETVKGIGPALSGKIVDARKTGTFKDWADLVDRVGGIGAGNSNRFSQAGLTVAGKAYDGAAAAAAKSSAKAPKMRRAAKSATADDAAATKPARARSNRKADAAATM